MLKEGKRKYNEQDVFVPWHLSSNFKMKNKNKQKKEEKNEIESENNQVKKEKEIYQRYNLIK